MPPRVDCIPAPPSAQIPCRCSAPTGLALPRNRPLETFARARWCNTSRRNIDAPQTTLGLFRTKWMSCCHCAFDIK